MKNIVIANLGRRVIAAIADFLLALFVYILLALYVFTPIANATMNYSDNYVALANYNIYSHLYVYVETDSSSVSRIVEVSDLSTINSSYDADIISVQDIDSVDEDVTFLDFEKYVRYYYLAYKTGNEDLLESPSDDFNLDTLKSPEYNEAIILEDGTSVLPIDYYTENWYKEEIILINDEDCLFEYVDDGSGNETLVLKEDTEENRESAINFFKQAIYDANYDMYYSDYYAELIDALTNASNVVYIVPFFIVLLVFYFAIPMIFKNGETLGKKMMGVGLINIKEFSVSKAQIALRQLTFIAIFSVSYFIIPIFSLSYNEGYVLSYIATLGLGCFIMLAVAFFNKTKKSVHDLAALTIVIDTRKSVWFKSLEEEETHESKLAAKLAEYKKIQVENKNIIQKGDQIIDPERVKKLIEDTEELKKDKHDKTNSLTEDKAISSDIEEK